MFAMLNHKNKQMKNQFTEKEWYFGGVAEVYSKDNQGKEIIIADFGYMDKEMNPAEMKFNAILASKAPAMLHALDQVIKFMYSQKSEFPVWMLEEIVESARGGDK